MVSKISYPGSSRNAVEEPRGRDDIEKCPSSSSPCGERSIQKSFKKGPARNAVKGPSHHVGPLELLRKRLRSRRIFRFPLNLQFLSRSAALAVLMCLANATMCLAMREEDTKSIRSDVATDGTPSRGPGNPNDHPVPLQLDDVDDYPDLGGIGTPTEPTPHAPRTATRAGASRRSKRPKRFGKSRQHVRNISDPAFFTFGGVEDRIPDAGTPKSTTSSVNAATAPFFLLEPMVQPEKSQFASDITYLDALKEYEETKIARQRHYQRALAKGMITAKPVTTTTSMDRAGRSKPRRRSSHSTTSTSERRSRSKNSSRRLLEAARDIELSKR